MFDPTYLLDLDIEEDEMPEFPLMPNYTDQDLDDMDAQIEWRDEYPFADFEPLPGEPEFDSEYDTFLSHWLAWYDGEAL